MKEVIDNSIIDKNSKDDQVHDLISLVLWSYNQERYIRDALRGVFSQTYSPLEILISDDCSTDSTFEIIRDEVAKYRGPHTVLVNRNERNVGIAGQVNHAVGLVRGALVVCAAGDDISLPQRVEKVVEVWKSHGKQAMSIYSSLIVIDEYGSDTGIIKYQDALLVGDMRRRVRGKVFVEGASHAFSPRLFELFGPLPNNAVNEDVIIQMRSALTYGVATVALPLVRYRKHAGSVNAYREDGSAAFSVRQRVLCDRSLVCLTQFAADMEKRKLLSLDSSADYRSVLKDAETEVSRQYDLVLLRKNVFSGDCNLLWLSRNTLMYLAKGLDVKSLASYFLWTASRTLFMWARGIRR